MAGGASSNMSHVSATASRVHASHSQYIDGKGEGQGRPSFQTLIPIAALYVPKLPKHFLVEFDDSFRFPLR